MLYLPMPPKSSSRFGMILDEGGGGAMVTMLLLVVRRRKVWRGSIYYYTCYINKYLKKKIILSVVIQSKEACYALDGAKHLSFLT
jgi:hypothetical protein